MGPLWRAIVPVSHGGVVLSTEHSQGGDALSGAALRDGEQRQRLKCCRQALVELTTKGGGQKQGEESKHKNEHLRGAKNRRAACVIAMSSSSTSRRFASESILLTLNATVF